MATQVRPKEDELLAEFRTLINQVGTAVARESVLPAMKQLINDWTAQTKKLETQFERNVRTLNEASLAIANSLEIHGRQLRSSMAADTKKWETALGQQAATLAQGLASANSEVSALGRSLEQLSAQLTGAWETAATTFQESCNRVLSDTDVPTQLAVLNEYTEESHAATDHLLQVTNSAVGAVERWQSEVAGALRAVESRLPTLTAEIGALNSGLKNWRLQADEVKRSNDNTARAVGEFVTLAHKAVKLNEAMAQTLSQQLLDVQGKLAGLADEARTVAKRMQQERSAGEAALRENVKEVEHLVQAGILRLEKRVQEESQTLHELLGRDMANTRSVLEKLMKTHESRLEGARASTAALVESSQRELWQATSRALGWLAALIVAIGAVLGWLHLLR